MFLILRSGSDVSIFKARTEDSSATQYFQFYGYLSQQQNMMQDFVRTSTYQVEEFDENTFLVLSFWGRFHQLFLTKIPSV